MTARSIDCLSPGAAGNGVSVSWPEDYLLHADINSDNLANKRFTFGTQATTDSSKIVIDGNINLKGGYLYLLRNLLLTGNLILETPFANGSPEPAIVNGTVAFQGTGIAWYNYAGIKRPDRITIIGSGNSTLRSSPGTYGLLFKDLIVKKDPGAKLVIDNTLLLTKGKFAVESGEVEIRNRPGYHSPVVFGH